MSNEQSLQRYLGELPKALLNFQYLEEALKQYLGRCHFMVASVVGSFVHYSVAPAERLEKLSLGRLIEVFRDFNANEDLNARLAKLPEKRNFVAHRAYVTVSASSESSVAIETAYEVLQEVIRASEQCLWQVLAEIQGLESRFIAFHDQTPPCRADGATLSPTERS